MVACSTTTVLSTSSRSKRFSSLLLLLTCFSDLSVGFSSLSSSSFTPFSPFHRQLEETDDAANAAVDDYFQYDLSQFSVRFEKCQYVKMYDDTLAENQYSDSPLALKHFVVYRLCPSNACQRNNSKVAITSTDVCDSEPHGVYTVDVETYLDTVIRYQMESFKRRCQNCKNGNCNDDYEGEACGACTQECENYNKLGDNGYVDAANYIQCKQLDVQNDDAGDDDANNKLYIGPRCNSTGKISIGLFSDEYCWKPVNKSVETVLGAKLWYNFLKQSYYTNDTCLSCAEDKNNENERDAQDQDNVNEMCENLYNDAAKCESDTGLSIGFVQANRVDGEYQNQVENEFLACTFINSLVWNSYTETGEINIGAPQDEIIRVVTPKQTLAMSLLAGTIVSLLGIAIYIERKIRQLAPALALKGDGEFS